MAAEVISFGLLSSAAKHALLDCRLLLVFVARHGSGDVQRLWLEKWLIYRLLACGDCTRVATKSERALVKKHPLTILRHSGICQSCSRLPVVDHRTNQRCKRCRSMPGWLCVIITLYVSTAPCLAAAFISHMPNSPTASPSRRSILVSCVDAWLVQLPSARTNQHRKGTA